MQLVDIENYILFVFDVIVADINECESMNGMCQQLCEDTDGSYVCLCEDGYVQSQENPLHCTGNVAHTHCSYSSRGNYSSSSQIAQSPFVHAQTWPRPLAILEMGSWFMLDTVCYEPPYYSYLAIYTPEWLHIMLLFSCLR